MASEWARSQREGWLCQLYGEESENGTRTLPPDSVQSRIVDNLEGLLVQNISPKMAAAQTASLVLTQEDESIPWINHVGLYLHATREFEDEEILGLLVEYLIEVASLPDAIHEGPGTKMINSGYGFQHTEPGQPIQVGGGKLWSDLPQYSMNLTEWWQGPEQYLKVHGGHKEPLEAMQAWKNINTYVALMAVHPRAKTIPVLARHTHRGLMTMVIALEYSIETRLGRNTELHAPAAAQWLRIAGKELEKLCNEGAVGFHPGDLWESRGGTNVCDSARLTFWKSRLSEMGY